MDIELNGQTSTIEADCTIAGLLEIEGFAQRRVAVEVNGEIVPRGSHASHVLQAGDTWRSCMPWVVVEAHAKARASAIIPR